MSNNTKPIGRSVEEVILLRKLQQNTAVLSLPAIKMSTGMSNLPPSAGSRKGERRTANPNAVYSEEDVRRMMEEVTTYTRTLQNRIKHLETELLAVSRNQLTRSSSERDIMALTASRESAAATRQSTAMHTTATNTAVHTAASTARPGTHTMTQPSTASQMNARSMTLAHDAILNIDLKVVNLKDIFRRKDPIEERYEGAVKIQTLIRGFLVRCRHRTYVAAQRDWRWMRCRPVVWLLDILLSNQSKLDTGFHLLKMNRTMRTLLTFYSKWAFIYRQNAPMRHAVREAALMKIDSRRKDLLKMVFDGLRAVSIGSMSTKNAIIERRKLTDRIRSDLSADLQALGLVGIVPEDEVFRVLHRKVVEQFHERKKVITLRAKFGAFVKLKQMAVKHELTARKHRFKKLAGKCFFAWSDHVYLTSRQLDRKRWPGPRKYEVRYNQKRVDFFGKVRCERFVFSAWKAYFAVQLQVKRRFQRKKAQFIMSVFTGWRSIARHQRSLRKKTYENWKGYAKLITSSPFQAWSDFVKGQKNLYNEHVRIARSYRRWKTRQKVAEIVKRWRHQALFGRIDGLYSRQMLLKSLGEQKILCSSLEKAMADQVLELEESKKVVQIEIDKRKGLEQEISKLTAQVNKGKMTLHHYEQELKRLTSMLDSMSLINPKQMQHIQALQADFKFKERHIAVSNAVPEETKPGGEAAAGGVVGAVAPKNVVGDAVVGEAKEISAAFSPPPNPPAIVNFEAKPATPTKTTTDFPPSTGGGTGAGGKEAVAASPHASPDKGGVGSKGEVLTLSRLGTPALPVAPVAPAEPSISPEDRALLVRVRWLLKTYSDVLPPSLLGGEVGGQLIHNSAPPLVIRLASTLDGKDAVAGAAVAVGDGDAGSVGGGLSSNNSLSSSVKRGALGLVEGGVGGGSNHSLSTIGSHPAVPAPVRRASLFKAPVEPTPFVSAVRDENGESAPQRRVSSIPRPPSVLLGLDKGSVGPGSRGSQNLDGALAAGAFGKETDFYTEEELEELVVRWARLLVCSFEFLAHGDISLLPDADKEAYTQHLLHQARGTGMFSSDAESPQPASSTIHYMDEAVKSGVSSWREGLLRLRALFPGAGNFSGLGVPLMDKEDGGLAQRAVHMMGEIRSIEQDYVMRREKKFIESQLPKPGAEEVKRKEEENDPNKLHVYAGNLSKVVQQIEEQEEREWEQSSAEYAMRALMPDLLLDEDEDEDGANMIDHKAMEGSEHGDGRKIEDDQSV